jgi:hypothetical protein
MDKLSGKKKFFINYSHNGFYESQIKALEFAKNFGFYTIGYKFDDLDQDFKHKNEEILKQPRGAGYWIWKPYIILKTLNMMQDGDYLIYMDSGASLIKNPDDYLRMINHKGILSFSMSFHKQSTWCKKDCFEYVFGEEYDYADHSQILASYVFIQKNNQSVEFVKRWLEICQIRQLIDDSDSISKNYSDFKEHRHDQAIYSLLIYKHDIMYLPDISQWCFEFGFDVENRKIVDHHRNRC